MPYVSVDPDGVRVTARDGEYILRALSRSGYGYRVGCRRGGCGTCKVDVLAGRVEYSDTVSDDVLSAGERAGGVALSCRALPIDDVVIRLRNDKLRRTSSLLAAVFASGDRTKEGNL